MKDFICKLHKKFIICAFAFILAMLLLGKYIDTKVIDDNIRQHEEAVQIDNDSELFQYALNTSAGNAYIYGTLQADNPVSYEGLQGQYLYIKRVEERYTKHYTKSLNGRYLREEYAWDEWTIEERHTDTITFCGMQFPYDQICRPDAKLTYIDNFASDKRYVYYTVPQTITGTVYNHLYNGVLTDKISMQENKNIEQSLNDLYAAGSLCRTIYWVLWIVLTLLVTYLMYLQWGCKS